MSLAPYSTPTLSSSPQPGPTVTGSVLNSSVRGSEVGKKQRHKEKLKFAGLDDSDGSALTQSGDEAEESSPPRDPSGLGTEVGTRRLEKMRTPKWQNVRHLVCSMHHRFRVGLLLCTGAHPPALHRTRASAKNYESSESSKEGRIYPHSFGRGHVILQNHQETKAVDSCDDPGPPTASRFDRP